MARLSAQDANERAAAADELGRRGYRFRDQIASALRPMLLKDPDANVRAAAGRALGRLGVREAIPELTRALTDESPAVRAVAAAALWRLPDAQAVPVLVERTHDPDAKVREWSTLALGASKDPRALPPLVAALRDTERSVRLAALRALGSSNNVAALPPLQGYLDAARDEEEKDETVNAVVSIEGSERVASLLALYAAAASDVAQKRRLLNALARVGDAQALPMLRKLASERADPRGLRAPATAAYNAVLARTADAGAPPAAGAALP
jgi:HEAT repeat protein